MDDWLEAAYEDRNGGEVDTAFEHDDDFGCYEEEDIEWDYGWEEIDEPY